MTKQIIQNSPLTKQAMDHVNTALKAVIGATPVVGSLGAAAFETIFTAPLDKRKQEWLDSMAQIINELFEKVEGLTPEKLANNEAFISAQLQAANIAIRTHYKERLSALKNAVKNSFLRTDIDEIKKMIFIRAIEDMTPLHFKALHFLTFPNHYEDLANSRLPKNTSMQWGGLTNIWNECIKDIRSDNPLLEFMINDLYRLGLSRITKLHEASMYSNATTMGKEFVGFIELETIL